MAKKSFLIMALAIGVIATTSCKKDNEKVDLRGPKMQISLEKMESEGGEKTIFDPTTKIFYWTTGDKLLVYDNSNHCIVYTDPEATGNYDYEQSTYSGSTSFINLQVSTETEDQTGCMSIKTDDTCYYAFFPSYYVDKERSSSAQGTFCYNIPSKQVIDNNENIDKIKEMYLTRYPMARKTRGHNFQMKNMCGAIRFKLQKAGVSVKSIEFKALGNQQVSGDFTVTFAKEGNVAGVPVLTQTVANSTTRKVTLEMNQPISIETQHEFFISLPPAIYNGFEIVITSADNKTATIRVSSDVEIKRNQIRALVIGEATFSGARAFKDSHGKFSIDDNHQVYIAPGNLQWNNHNWQFADEQYEIMSGGGCNVPMRVDAHNQDMFHYSLKQCNTQYQNNGYQVTWVNGKPVVESYTYWRNSKFGRMTDYTYYESSFNQTTATGVSAMYQNWGEAFGESSDWMVLSSAEYQYMVQTRPSRGKCHCTVGNTDTASFCLVNVRDDDGVEHPGLLLFPDNWENGWTNELIASAIEWKDGWQINTTGLTWEATNMFMDMNTYRILEEAGCAFLPCTGYAQGWSTDVTLAGCISRGANNEGTFDARLGYWTSTCSSHTSCSYDDNARTTTDNFVAFTYENGPFHYQNYTPDKFCAVRLFMPVPTSSTNN